MCWKQCAVRDAARLGIPNGQCVQGQSLAEMVTMQIIRGELQATVTVVCTKNSVVEATNVQGKRTTLNGPKWSEPFDRFKLITPI